jgi:GTPase SAR1 family protein
MSKQSINKILIVGDACRGKSTLDQNFLQNLKYHTTQLMIFFMK